jgi:hypothetical protein
MATRHERRRKARALALAAERREIVRRNLSAPADTFRPRGSLISGVYRGEGGRARGLGVEPMSHKVTAVFARRPEVAALLYPPSVKVYRAR